MYIKSIELEGFKSYQKHVEIAPFSPRFNAITGYNGSGKSNVLDSICFLLGITKLDAVRAKTMSELIAHGGTKATVQIRFDNTNKSQSPFGMENFNEITVVRTIVSNGRQCNTNYTLNGHSVPNSRMVDFFRGVGLNVNNPHFLIMQGRITTVLNMKPEEILGMVEEAAGTKMYDHKKKEAEKTMFVKESKLKEIDNIFQASIDPRMEKFREDRKNMIEVTRLQKMRENSKRKADAYDYYQSMERSNADAVNMERQRKALSDKEAEIIKLAEDAKKKEEEKTELEHLRDHPRQEQALDEEQKATQDHHIQCEQNMKVLIDETDRLDREVNLGEQRLKSDEAEIVKTQSMIDEIKKSNADSLNTNDRAEKRIADIDEELETLARGTIKNSQGQQVSLESAIQDQRSEAAVKDTKVKTATNRRNRLQPQMNTIRDKIKALGSKSKHENEQLKKLEADVAHYHKELQDLKFDRDGDKEKRERHEHNVNKMKSLKQSVDEHLERTCGGRYAFSLINPPTNNFDYDRDVEGLVVWLVKLKPEYREYHQAVDIALGASYCNIVVRDQEVARILIECKSFTGRRTLIPVSENGRTGKAPVIEDSQLQKAQAVADKYGEKVMRLIDMVEFPEKVDNTFRTALGTILVVQSLACAREVAFADGVNTRVLTGRGDDVKVNGVMSGGASEKGEQYVITALECIHKPLEDIAKMKAEQVGLNDYLTKIEVDYKKYCDVDAKLTDAEKKLANFQSHMRSSELGRLQAELAGLEDEDRKITAEIEETSKELATMKTKIQDLESRKTDDKGSMEKRKQDLHAERKRLETQKSKNTDSVEKAKAEIRVHEMTLNNLNNSVETERSEQERRKKRLDEIKKDMPELKKKVELAEENMKTAERKMKSLKAEQRNVVDRIAKVQKDMTVLRKQEIKLNNEKNDIEKEITRLIESEKAHKKYASDLLKKHEWLVDEQAHFNKKGGLYDFNGYTANKGAAEQKELSDKIEKLERNLCMKNVANLDSCEARVIDIKNKRDKLHEDFDILKKTIAVLDKKKTDELERAHESVNRDFGKIFNCLLPDATAQLRPPEGKTVCEGLEVKVAFNGVEKESLHELSGGQRSLVALSLILAMLKFKPAPLYILDEVDAALDLSHTANIGKMIKAHFNNNQFIIVSLKQGMFSNAECLFQTHFADGHSSCTRLTGAALDAARNDAKLAAQADELEEAAKAAKKPVKKATKKTAPRVEEEVDEMA